MSDYLIRLILLLKNLIFIDEGNFSDNRTIASHLSDSIVKCNGFEELCNRRYDSVCIAMTHNSYNYQGDFKFPNQEVPVYSQLSDGIRGLMLDVYEDDGKIYLYHGSPKLGKQLLSEVLKDIAEFLSEHPYEIITIIFENQISNQMLLAELENSNLSQFLWKSELRGSQIPSLQTMIMLNHRLVVFVERDIGKSVEGIFPAWNFIKETRYGVKGKFDLDCEINRGKNESNLLLINHFVSNLIPDERASKRINYQPFLQERVEKCSSEFQNFPTYIGIDFYKKSDVLKVVNIINGVD